MSSSSSVTVVAYLGAVILFILSLGGLSNPETSRRGNLYGMIGMAIAVLATVLGPHVTKAAYPWIVGAVLVGFANHIDPAASAGLQGAEETVHKLEIYVGVLIGAVTFSGSLIAFGKLS